ncbi:hypothetical protein MC885_016568 [Smutsia gigantea]|nr:hypothetical protein MC885_016568 [Smutsia gigantea]
MYPFMSGAIFITVFDNLAMIISISYFKQLHTPSNLLILPMEVTNFLLGLTIMPYSMIRSVENCWYFGLTFCKIHHSFDLMLSVASIFHLCSVAIDRFHAICYPLRYSTKMTISIMLNKLWGTTWFMAGFFTPGSVVVGIYGKIFAVSRKHACAINNLPENQNNEMRQDKKAAKTLGIVMGVFLLCWFPCFFTILPGPFLNFSTPVVLFDALT